MVHQASDVHPGWPHLVQHLPFLLHLYPLDKVWSGYLQCFSIQKYNIQFNIIYLYQTSWCSPVISSTRSMLISEFCFILFKCWLLVFLYHKMYIKLNWDSDAWIIRFYLDFMFHKQKQVVVYTICIIFLLFLDQSQNRRMSRQQSTDKTPSLPRAGAQNMARKIDEAVRMRNNDFMKKVPDSGQSG